MAIKNPYQGALKYVMERKTKRGGFCFYKLDEPNAFDTYLAISILFLLKVDFQDESTIIFLKKFQRKDEQYISVNTAFYSIKALYLLGKIPEHDPIPFIKENINWILNNSEDLDIELILTQLLHLIDLCNLLKIVPQGETKEKIVDIVLNIKNRDQGFGNPNSTLMITSLVLSILNFLQYDMNSLKTINFLKACESSIFGFLNLPNTAPSFIEHVHAGLVVSDILNYKPSYLIQCNKFILNCQNLTGGFSRAKPGVATLENTFQAIDSLSIIKKIKNRINV